MKTKITTLDGKTFSLPGVKIVGSVKKICDKDVSKEPIVGQFPVFVEQTGGYRIFTYSKKISKIEYV